MDIREAIDEVGLRAFPSAWKMPHPSCARSWKVRPPRPSWGSFLTGLRIKGETAQEIAGNGRGHAGGFALRVEVDGPLIDTVGTGGDGQNTFNVSTATAFVAAAAGLKVAKHGNRAASGTCGKRRRAGGPRVKIDLPPEGVGPVHRGGWRRIHVRPGVPSGDASRRPGEAGDRHPHSLQHSRPAYQSCRGADPIAGGRFPGKLGETMAEVLRMLGSHRAMIVHGHGGMDELSLSGDSTVWKSARER